jgi:hypothetical protein
MPGPLARSNHDTDAPGLRAHKLSWYIATLAAGLTVDDTYPNNCKLDPGGAHRDVTLDAVATSAGITRRFVNAADAAENLVLKNVGGDTIGTANQNEEIEVYCDGSTWVLIAIHTIALS